MFVWHEQHPTGGSPSVIEVGELLDALHAFRKKGGAGREKPSYSVKFISSGSVVVRKRNCPKAEGPEQVAWVPPGPAIGILERRVEYDASNAVA